MGVWAKYFANKTKTFNFDDLGIPDFWIIMRSVDTISVGMAKEKMGMDEDELTNEETFEISSALMCQLIVDWNITDPEKDDDKPMPLPSQDPSVIDKLPTEFLGKISEWLKQEAKTIDVPPESENSSSTP